MDLYSNDYSHVAIHETFIPNDDELCDACKYYDEWNTMACECPQNSAGLINCIGVYTVYQMRVNGAPAKMTQFESDYTIRKFVLNDVGQAETSIYDLTTDDLVQEFTISSTEDPRDLESLYGKFVKNLVSGWKPTQDQRNFSSKSPASLYIDQFVKIVNNILNPPPPRETSENPHISVRGKKNKINSKSKKK